MFRESGQSIELTETNSDLPNRPKAKLIENFTETNAKPQVVDYNLLKQIQSINSLPSESLGHRYSSLSATEAGFKGSRTLADKDALELTMLLASNEEPEQMPEYDLETILSLLTEKQLMKPGIINRLSTWIGVDPPERIKQLEVRLTKHIEQGNELSITLLAALAELNSQQNKFSVDFDLMRPLEDAEQTLLPPAVLDQIAVLNRLNTKESSLALHKILDFMTEYMVAAREDGLRNSDESDLYGPYGAQGLYEEFIGFAEREIKKTPNYLLKKHWQDALDAEEIMFAEDATTTLKEGALGNVIGGSGDQNIYAFAHQQESQALRAANNISAGNHISHPVLPLAPGYAGLYEHGSLKTIYKQDQLSNTAVTKQEEQEWAAKNNSADEYIYDALEGDTWKHNASVSDKLAKLQNIWDFLKGSKATERKFYFDTERIDLANLHPLVTAEILENNEKYIQQHKNQQTPPESITEEQYAKEFFPLGERDDNAKYEYRYLLSLQMRKRFEDDFKMPVESLSLWEQRNFLSFLETESVEEIKQLQDFIAKNGHEGLRAFLSLEFDPAAGKKILELAEKIATPEMTSILKQYSTLVNYAETNSTELAKEFMADNEQTSFESAVFEGLLVRAKDVLMTAHRRVIKQGENPEQVINSTIGELEQESPKQRTVSGCFRKTAELLADREPGSVEITSLVRQNDEILNELKQNNGLPMFLRALTSRGELAEIPEIHWRVDRGLEEYRLRFGLDIEILTQALADPERKKILFEFGPGCGKSKLERTEQTDGRWTDIAMADKLYYPLNGFVNAMIDWPKLEKAIGIKLSEADQEILSDMLYKVVMIQDRQTEQDHFEYHTERMERLKNNPNAIRQILAEIAPQLPDISIVPTTISTRDDKGNVIYTYKRDIKQAKESSPALAKAIAEIGDAERINKYVAEKDAFEAVPAYPAGIIVGDFSLIEALKSEQVDLAIGVRSTVYKYNQEYVDFLVEMTDKLSSDGLYIADCVRDNDGWYYRLAEAVEFINREQAKQKNGQADYQLNVAVILGEGFPGEDHRQEKVPSALVISKNKDYSQLIASNLDSGFEIVALEDLVSEAGKVKYDVAGLDATGHTLQKLEEAQGVVTDAEDELAIAA